MSDLILDVLPRVGRMEIPSGITIYGAATSVQSLIFKRLLDRRSDLLATGNLFLIIPAYDYMAPVPSDFLSMAEKPRAMEAPLWLTASAWMAGTVTSYDPGTKTLILNVTAFNGSGTIAAWNVAVGVLPGQPIFTVDTSVSSVAVGIGAKTFVTVTALSLVPGQNVILSNVLLPDDSGVYSRMDPSSLDDDDHEDYRWWDEYRLYSDRFETATQRPRKFKVISTNFYVRPKVTAPVMVTGKYNARPSVLTAATDTLPWNDLFYETFKECVVRILLKGIAIPDSDPDIAGLIQRDIDTVLGSRVRLLPDTHRIKRSNYQ
jgi:hypothetical protein